MHKLTEELLRRYKKHGSIIIAFDFDDTVHNPTTRTIEGCEDAVNALRALKPFARFICYTARQTSKENKDYIFDFCQDNNIPLETINENIASWYGYPSKLYYNILLDDRAGLKETIQILREFIIALRS